MNLDSSGGWCLGAWSYWPDSGELKSQNQTVRLSTQLNQVLWLLVQDSPAVVTRQHFLEVVWANKYVNEDALSRTIAELRKILGDSANQAKYIKTIPKKGYQLIHPTEPVKDKNTRRVKTFLFILLMTLILIASYWMNHKDATVSLLQDAVANASRVTAQPGMERQSILSDDGQWLVYVKNSTASRQIIIESVEDANQQTVVELPRHRLSSPVFIPAQKLLFFTAKDQVNCYLKSYDLNTQLFTDLSSCYFNSESRTLNWDTELNSLFYADLNNQQQIIIQQLELSTGQITSLTHPVSANEQDWSPQISPDQKWLSFSRGNESVRNIWLKNLQSGDEYAITQGEHYSVSHAWYDDDHIVFDSDLSGSRQLWLLNIHDSTPQLLGAYGAQHPSFDHDRRSMAFQEVSYEANIWLLDIASEDYSRAVHSTKYDNYPAFSSDGRRFLFSSNRQDLSSIWLYDLTTGNEKLLISQPEAKLTRPSWHHNGHQILMTINDERGYGTLVLDLQTMQTEYLDFGYGHKAAIEFEGNYFALAKSIELQDKILYMQKGQVEILPIDGVSRFMLLSDGRLVFSKTQLVGLYIYDLESQQQSVLTTDLNSSSMGHWTAINHAVYFERGGKYSGIWRIDVDTDALTLVTQHRPYSVGTSLSVNKDETQILITRTDRAESDIFKTNIK